MVRLTGLYLVAIMLFALLSLSVPFSCKPLRRQQMAPRYTMTSSRKIELYLQKIASSGAPSTAGEMELIMLAADESMLAMLSSEITSSSKFKEAENRCKLIGRASVDAALQRFQRLIQQLDRSDGRPDISYDQLADRFYDFIGTALRTPGEAYLVMIC